MTILKNLIERRSADSQIAQFINMRNNAGANPGGFDAMRHEAVWACVNLIADAASTLPIDIYTRRGDARIPVDTPQIISAPSGVLSATAWRRQIMISWLIQGNAYGLVIDRDNLGFPTQMEIVNPYDVTFKFEGNTGKKIYSIQGKEVDSENLEHFPGLVLPGSDEGISPISYARQQINTGLYAGHFGEEYFSRGTKANGILAFQTKVSEDIAIAAKQKFIDSAQNANEPVVLTADIKYTPLNISPADAQYLETQQASGQSIARMFRVPPEKIGYDSGKSMTYSTVEGNSRSFLQDTLNPWLVRLEELHNRLIPSDQYTKINRNAALAVDLMTRYNAHQIGIRSGFLSVNDVREVEDREPIEDGDRYMWPAYAFGQIGQEEPLGQ